MKSHRTNLVVTVFGIFQVITGTLFLTLGGWALIKTRFSLQDTYYAPFWLTVLSLFNGFLTILAPRHRVKYLFYSLIQVCILSCFASAALTGWMVKALLNHKDTHEVLYYSLMIALCVNLFIISSIVCWLAWSSRTPVRRTRTSSPSERSVQQNLPTTRGVYYGPPPGYNPNAGMYYHQENFNIPAQQSSFPPPYLL